MEALNFGMVPGRTERHIQRQQMLVGRMSLDRAGRLPAVIIVEAAKNAAPPNP